MPALTPRIAALPTLASTPSSPVKRFDLHGPGLDVAVGLARLVVELTPDMDRRGSAALEHRAGQRRNLAVRRMVEQVVVVDTQARERLQVVGVAEPDSMFSAML